MILIAAIILASDSAITLVRFRPSKACTLVMRTYWENGSHLQVPFTGRTPKGSYSLGGGGSRHLLAISF